MCVIRSPLRTQYSVIVRLVAHRQAVAPHPALLQVSGLDDQHVASIAAGRETHPRVRRVRAWMRPAVHVDRPGLFVGAVVVLDRDQILRLRVPFLPDPEVGRATVDVRGDVHAALLFGQRDARGIPAVGELPRGFVDRQPEIVHELGSRNALEKVFLISRLPHARKVRLRPSRAACEHGQKASRQHDCCPSIYAVHMIMPSIFEVHWFTV